MKKVFSVLAVIFLCLSMPVSTSVSASSVPSDMVQPCYEKAVDTLSRLEITGNTAICESKTLCMSNVVKVTAVQTLEKQVFLWFWGTYDNTTWTKTTYTNSLFMSNTKSGLAAGNYRVKTVFTLTDNNGETETITTYSDEKTVS